MAGLAWRGGWVRSGMNAWMRPCVRLFVGRMPPPPFVVGGCLSVAGGVCCVIGPNNGGGQQSKSCKRTTTYQDGRCPRGGREGRGGREAAGCCGTDDDIRRGYGIVVCRPGGRFLLPSLPDRGGSGDARTHERTHNRTHEHTQTNERTNTTREQRGKQPDTQPTERRGRSEGRNGNTRAGNLQRSGRRHRQQHHPATA